MKVKYVMHAKVALGKWVVVRGFAYKWTGACASQSMCPPVGCPHAAQSRVHWNKRGTAKPCGMGPFCTFGPILPY